MTTTIAELKIKIGADTKDAESSLKKLTTLLEQFGANSSKLGEQFSKMGSSVSSGLKAAETSADSVKTKLSGLENSVKSVSTSVTTAGSSFGKLGSMASSALSGVTAPLEAIKSKLSGFGSFFSPITNGISGIGSAFSNLGSLASGPLNAVKTALTGIGSEFGKLGSLASSGLSALSGPVNSAKNALENGLHGAITRVQSGFSSLASGAGSVVSALGSIASQAGGTVVSAFEQMSGAVGKASGVLGGFVVAGTAAVAGFTAAGVKMAGDLQQSIANISTIKPDIDTTVVFNKLNELSTKVPQTAAQLGSSLYNIFSSVDVTTEEGLALVEKFSKGAVGAGTDAETFGTAIMGVMNAYKLQLKDVDGIQDVFFNTVNRGVVSGPELAASLGMVTAGAKQAGVGFSELGALIVGVTKEGGPAAQNINNLNNLFGKITTTDAQNAIKGLGVAVTNQDGSFRSIIDVMGDLKVKLGSMTDSARAAYMQKIFPDLQARTGAATIMSELDAVKAALNENKSATGSANSAFEKMNATFNSQATIVGNTFKSLMTTVGAQFLPILTEGLKGLQGFLSGIAEPLKNVASLLAGGLAKAVSMVAEGFGVLKEAFSGQMLPSGPLNAFTQIFWSLGKVILTVRDGVLTFIAAMSGNWADSEKIMPIHRAIGNFALLLRNEVIPTIQAVIGKFMEFVTPIANAILPVLGQFLPYLAGAAGIVATLGAAFATASAVIAPIAGIIGALVSPIGLVIAAVAGLMYAWQNDFLGIREAVIPVVTSLVNVFESQILPALSNLANFVMSTVIPAIGQAAQWFSGVLTPVLAALGNFIAGTVIPIIGQLVTFFVNQVVPAVMNVAQIIGTVAKPVIEALANFITGTLIPALAQFGSFIQSDVIPAFVGIFNYLNANVFPVLQQLAQWLGPILGEAVNFLGGVIGQVIGVVGNVAHALWDTLGGVIQAIGALLKGDFSGAWNFVSGAIGRAWDAITGAVGGAVNVVLSALGKLWSYVSGPVTSVWNTITGAVSSAWNSVVSAIGGALNSIWSSIVGAWNGITGAISSAMSRIWNFIVSIWNAVVNFIRSVVTAIVNVITTGWNFVAGIVSSVLSVILGIVSSVWNVIASVVGAVVGVIVEIVSTAWNVIADVTGFVWNTLSTIIGGVISVIASIVGAEINGIVTIVGGAWDIISSLTGAAWGVISSVISGVWDIISSIVGTAVGVISSVISTAWDAISSATSTAWGVISSVISGVWDTISSIISTGVGVVSSIVSTAWDAISSVTGSVWNSLTSIIGGVISGIQSTVGSGVEGAKSALDTAWHSIQEITQTVWDAVKTIISGVVDFFTKTVPEKAQEVWHGITDAWNNVKQATSQAWEAVKKAVTDGLNGIINGIKGFVNQALDAATSIGKAIIDGIVNAVKAGGKAIMDAVGAVVSSPVDFAKSILGIHSPSKVFNDIGWNIILGFEQGILNGKDKPANAIAEVAKGVETKALDAATKQADAVSKIAGAASSMAEALQKVSTYSGGAKEHMAQFGADTTALVGEFVAGAGAFKKDALKGAEAYSDSASKVASGAGAMATALGALKNYAVLGKEHIRAFTQDVFALTAEFYNNSTSFNVKMLAATEVYAETTDAVASGAKSAVEVLTKLQNYSTVQQTTIEAFARDTFVLVANFYNMSQFFSAKMLEAATTYASAAGDVAKAAKDGVDALTKLTSYSGVSQTTIESFSYDMFVLVANFYNMSNYFKAEMLKAAEDFANTGAKVAESISKGVAGLSALEKYKGVNIAVLGIFVNDLMIAVHLFKEASLLFKTEMLQAAEDFAKTGAGIADTIGKGVAGLQALNTYRGMNSLILAQFVNDMIIAVRQVSTASQQFKAESLKAGADFANAFKPIVDGLSAGIKFFADLRQYASTPSNVMLAFFDDLRITIALTQAIASSYSTDMMEQVTKFGASVKQVFDGLKAAVDMFKALEGSKGVMPGAIDALLGAVNYTIEKAGQAAAIVEGDLFPKALDFALSSAKVFGGLKVAVDLFKELANVKDNPANGVNALIDGMNAAAGKMGTLQGQADTFLKAAQHYLETMSQAAAYIKQGADLAKTSGAGGAENLADSTKAALGIHSPSKVFDEIGQNIMAGLKQGLEKGGGGAAKALNDITGSLTDKAVENAAKQADSLTKVAETVIKMRDAMSALASYNGVDRVTLMRFVDDSVVMLSYFAKAASQFKEDVFKSATNYSDALSKVSDSLTKSVKAFTDLNNYSAPMESSIESFAESSAQVIAIFAGMAKEANVDMLAASAAYASALDKSMSVISNSVTGLNALNTYSGAASDKMTAFVNDSYLMVQKFAQAGASFSQEALKGAGAYADTLKGVTDSLTGALKLFAGLVDMEKLPTGAIDDLITRTNYVLYRVVVSSKLFDKNALSGAVSYANTVSTVMTALRTGVIALGELVDASVSPNDTITELIRNLSGAITSMALANDKAKIFYDAADSFAKRMEGAAQRINSGASAVANAAGKIPNMGIPGFATGGVVPGPEGAPMLVLAHGGERFVGLNGERRDLLSHTGSGDSGALTVNFNGNIVLPPGTNVNNPDALKAAMVAVAKEVIKGEGRAVLDRRGFGGGSGVRL